MFKRLSVLFLIVAVAVNGQESALTRGGDEVILNPDGTWEYVTKADKDSTADFAFRNVKWGSAQKLAKAEEKSELIPEVSDDQILGYSGSVGGLKSLIAYVFVDDQLWKGTYIFSEKHSNRNKYLEDYSKIKNILIDKYGEPSDENVHWSNDLYAEDQSQYGFAVSMGHLSFYSTWEIGETVISVTLTGDNYKIDHKVEYYNEHLRKIAAQQQKKQSSSDF